MAENRDRRNLTKPCLGRPDHGASDLARRLGSEAEAVCRHYLSAGHREGRYWLVGDIANSPGRSMFVRLAGPATGKGAAGKWTDAATGEHGDLLDVIRARCGLTRFHDVAEEARRFLSLSRPEPSSDPPFRQAQAPAGSPEAARRLLVISRPIAGTLVEVYLRNRGITDLRGTGALRFHSRCYYRPHADDLSGISPTGLSPSRTLPAMIAAVTDLAGGITGAHRTYLDPAGLDPQGFSETTLGKAPIATPRRAMGDLLGHAVRFGIADDVMAAGEGIETVLSLRMGLPLMPVAAALSAGHLGALLFPPTLRRLYITRDADSAGNQATAKLMERAGAAGIEAIPLVPQLGDFNEDLRRFGLDALRAALRVQIAPEDVVRFMRLAA